MRKVFIYSSLFSFILFSCRSNKLVKETNIIDKNSNIEGISLDANHVPDNEFKLVYNSIDTISTILIIDKKVIEKSKIRLVLDTIKMQNYRVNVNKDKRTIELTKN